MNAPLSLAHDAPLHRAGLLAEWRVALRLLAGAALFGAIVGSIGCASPASPVASSDGRHCPRAVQNVAIGTVS